MAVYQRSIACYVYYTPKICHYCVLASIKLSTKISTVLVFRYIHCKVNLFLPTNSINKRKHDIG
jgi:hypothetical protein